MDSWTLGYNLFADVWLGTNFIDSSVGILLISTLSCRTETLIRVRLQIYDGQSSFLNDLFTSNFSDHLFGMPVDNIGTDTRFVADG